MAQIGTVRLETQNSGVVDVPVFEPGDSASGIYEFVRVETASGPGFIPVTDPADATYPYLRVQSQNNGIVAVTDTPGSDIPDTGVIHDLNEKQNIDDYSGDTGSFTVNNTSPSIVGEYSLKMSPEDANVRIVSASGLSNYPSQDDTFAAFLNDVSNLCIPIIFFGVQDINNFYGVGIRADGGIEVYKDGTTSSDIIADESVPEINQDTWYDVEVDWQADGGIIITVFSVDNDGIRQSTVGSISTNDSTYSSGGFGWGASSGSGYGAGDFARLTN